MNQTSARITQRGFGLPLDIGMDVILPAASAAQEEGYHSFWLNNPSNTSALGALADVGGTAPGLWLGVGVIPLSTFEADTIARELRERQVPLDRFYLGLGSGSGAGGVDRVRQGLRALRRQLDARLIVAAMGPRMCRLAGAEADGVLFNWLTPEMARRSEVWVRAGAETAEKPMPRLMAYVRVAVGAEGEGRLRQEAERYSRIPQYAQHFERMGVSAFDTAVTGSTADEIERGLAAWDGVLDEVVVRCVPAHDTVKDVQAVLEAAVPRS